MLRRLLRQLGAAAFSLVFGVVVVTAVGEVAVRLFVREPVPHVVPSDNPRLVYELNPERPQINSFGMREEEVDPAQLSGQIRIAVIGDSHAYSPFAFALDDTFPQRTEHYLNQELGEGAVEVLNFGVGGYNTAQELEVLRSRALAFDPQLVVLQFTVNDIHVCNYLLPEHPRLNRLLHHSRFLVAVWKRLLYSPFGQETLLGWVEREAPDLLLYLPGLVGTSRPAPDEDRAHPPRSAARVPPRYHYMLGWDNWRRHVAEFGRLCRERGIPCVATGFQTEPVRAEFEENGFSVYPFEEIFRGRSMRSYGYDPERSGGHFNAGGCDLIGLRLARFLLRRGLLPEAPAGAS